ncbi:MAG: hypothetical protein PHW10_00300 [Candidatus Peribacteraceae bacterium]|nr:hypothetical protein [Candidatus Peribacteraceae bacterium]
MHINNQHLSETDSLRPPERDAPREDVRLLLEGRRYDTRDRLSPFIDIGTNALRQEEVQKEPNQESPKPKPVMPRRPAVENHIPPDMFPAFAVPPSQERTDVPRETVMKGTVAAALGTGAAAPVLAYGVATGVNTILASQIPGALTISSLGISSGIPLLGTATGYYAGKKLGHPVVGALTGTAVGVAVASGVSTAAVMAPLGGFLSTLSGIGAASSALPFVASTAVAGGALYGLGRWHGKVWNSEPAGILKTMGRGIVSPVSVPLGYINKLRKR